MCEFLAVRGILESVWNEPSYQAICGANGILVRFQLPYYCSPN